MTGSNPQEGFVMVMTRVALTEAKYRNIAGKREGRQPAEPAALSITVGGHDLISLAAALEAREAERLIDEFLAGTKTKERIAR